MGDGMRDDAADVSSEVDDTASEVDSATDAAKTASESDDAIDTADAAKTASESGEGDRGDNGGQGAADGLPDDVVSEAERLTRLARRVGDEAEAAVYREKRAETVAEHGYAARFREDDETLVLYPDEWLAGDTVELSRVRDTSRAVEVPLSASVGEADFEAVEAHNAALVEAVEAAYGPRHAANVRAFADFMGNHYLGRIDEATDEQLAEFRAEYYPRNVWPSAEQAAVLEASLEHLFSVAEQTDRRDYASGDRGRKDGAPRDGEPKDGTPRE